MIRTADQLARVPDRGKPILYASWQDLGILSDAAWDALLQANDPPRYFRHGCVPVRIEEDDNGAPVIRELNVDRLRHEMALNAAWKATKRDKNGTEVEVDAKPPIDVVKDMLAAPNPPLPVLNRIVEAPVFAPDGTVAIAPGYHSAGRVWYQPAPDVAIPDIPERPDQEDVREAVRRMLDLLPDFPLVGDADASHAIGLALLPFARDLIQGPTPNHMVESPGPGSGKGLLAGVLVSPAVGGNMGVVPEARNDDEYRKRITAQLRAGRSVIMLDNIVRTLDSGVLAAALTAIQWDDRVLGASEMLTMSVRCAWITTANNPTMSTEIARRSIRIRLDPKMDRPWQRANFLHPDLRAYAADNRGNLIWACLVMIRAWINSGRPRPSVRPLGSYESWSHVIGGVLEHANVGGFLGNLEEFYEVADSEGHEWRVFTAAWWAKHYDQEVGVSELYDIAVATDTLDLGKTGKGTERSQRIVLGKKLVKKRDRVVGDYRILPVGEGVRAAKWRLTLIRKVGE
ncbi:hypothetical protein K0B90_03150 [bacterium]|nr:hypothetical protein [bacterium]